MRKIYCFDIDDTICKSIDIDYSRSSPYPDRIEAINKLYDEGNIIKLYTARGSLTKIDHSDLTKSQLNKWGLKYHELHFGKPNADLYIDDKGADLFGWFKA